MSGTGSCPAGPAGGRRLSMRNLAAGRRRGVLQEPSPLRLADGQHGPTGAQHGSGIWNPESARTSAGVDIDRAHALRQGEFLGCPSRAVWSLRSGETTVAARCRSRSRRRCRWWCARSGVARFPDLGTPSRATLMRAGCRPGHRYGSPESPSGILVVPCGCQKGGTERRRSPQSAGRPRRARGATAHDRTARRGR